MPNCKKCGKKLIKSDNPEYNYQCLNCDEDFYTFETIQKNKQSNIKKYAKL